MGLRFFVSTGVWSMVLWSINAKRYSTPSEMAHEPPVLWPSCSPSDACAIVTGSEKAWPDCCRAHDPCQTTLARRRPDGSSHTVPKRYSSLLKVCIFQKKFRVSLQNNLVLDIPTKFLQDSSSVQYTCTSTVYLFNWKFFHLILLVIQ